MPYDKIEYNKNFTKNHYENVTIRVPKGKRELIQEKAKELSKSVNELVIEALEKQYDLFIKQF